MILEEFYKLEKELGKSPSKRSSSHLYYFSRKLFGSWNNLLIATGHHVKKIQEPMIPSLDNTHIYYFLGLVFSDGHLQFIKEGGKYKLLLYTSEKDERDVIIKLIDNLFHYRAKIRIRNTGFSKNYNFEIYICSKRVCEFIHSLGVPYGRKIESIQVPIFLFDSSKEFIGSFLRGVFDGDGSITLTKINSVLKISSKSHKFIQGLKLLFEKVGIASNIYEETNSLWQVRISRVEELKKVYLLFYKKALFFNSRKKFRWSKTFK